MKQKTKHVIYFWAAAILCAGAFMTLFLDYYRPSISVLAGSFLLQDLHGKKEKIEFSLKDVSTGETYNWEVPLQNYQLFYEWVAYEKSLENVPQDISEVLFKSPPAILMMTPFSEAKLFQVIQFVPEDYFRAQVLGKAHQEWVYFYQAGMYQKVIHLFNSSAAP